MKTDSFWKEVLETLFREFMQFFFPKIYQDIDFGKGYQFLDKEFQQITKHSKSGKKIVDKLVKVYLKGGWETWLLIHIEIQGQKGTDFAQRMYMYNYRIFDKYRKEVISLALLTDPDPNYLPNIYETKRWDFYHVFKFPLVKIINYINYDFERAYNKNIFALIVQAYLKTLETEGDDQTRFRWKRQFILLLYELGFTHETLVQVYRFIEWIMVLPDPLEDRLYDDLKQIEGDKTMPFLTYAERKGLKEGRKKGLIEGIQKGMQKGQILGLQKAIISVLEVKFAQADQTVIESVNKIQSLKKLEDLLHRAKIVKSMEEFAELLRD